MENSIVFKKGDKYTLLLCEKENCAVKTAVANLCKDFAATMEIEIQVVELNMLEFKADMLRDYDIFVGTIGESRIMDLIVAKNMINVYGIQDENKKLRKEGYVMAEQEGTLVIAGVGRRGTIYGIYELSEQLGVSPWYFFADVAIKKRDEFCIKKNYYKADYPSVEYRGIFINDEEELEVWAKKHTSDDTIGLETYKHIFELLLRLKANYIWPAMHVNSFNADVENGRLADSMGIVVGTSHCDMLMRSNNREWEPWVKKKGYEGLKYDYTIPGENRERLIEYWQESVDQNKDFEVCYTVGMRGIHDSRFMTERIDNNEKLTPEEKQRDKVKLLGDIIDIQKGIITYTLNNKNQLMSFVPYKEVLPMYDNGLKLPDNITTIWVDDNFGYMRRYPSKEECKRKGGHGLYYHASYWAHPGMSYLFFGSMPLAHIQNELRKAYESGIRKMWVLNVGALKPIEQELDFFAKYAWEIGKEDAVTADVRDYLVEWVNKTFSGNFGEHVADICIKFTQMSNVRKVEHLGFDVFSQTAYGDEAIRRLNEYKKLLKKADAIYFALPKEEQPAFFELILMKIQAAYYIYASFYCADRSALCYEQGKFKAADYYCEKSRMFDSYKRRLIEYYNKKLLDGKWDGILTPESYPPPRTALFPASRPALKIEGEPKMKLTLWEGSKGTDNTLVFSKYGIESKWIEIANTGNGQFVYVIEAPEWISLSANDGIIETEERIIVKPMNISKHLGETGVIKVTNTYDNESVEIKVKIEPEHFSFGTSGYLEADGYISVQCAKCDLISNNEKGEFRLISYLGRHEGSLLEANTADLEALEGDISENPFVEYTFNNYSEGCFTVEFYRFMTLNSKGRIRFAVSVDGGEPEVVETPVNDEWKGNWRDSVMDNVDKVLYTLPFLEAGEHKLRIYMIDNYVAFSKFVIYTNGLRKSNLGPELSAHTLYDTLKIGEDFTEETISFDEEYLAEVADSIYETPVSELPARDTYYAAYKQWRGTLANHAIVKPLEGVPEKKTYLDAKGEKDVTTSFGTGMFLEKDGVIALEAESVLENSEYACIKPGKDDESGNWIHSDAETCAGTGFAMYIREKGARWLEPSEASSLNYKVRVSKPGTYCMWILVKFDTLTKGTCYVGVDDYIQPAEEQYMKGSIFAYSAEQIWRWTPLTDVEFTEGEHTLSLYAARSDFRIDRIYLTMTDELPPDDFEWKDSERA